MWNILRQIFFFRVGRNATRGTMRLIGLGRFAAVAGLIGGIRYMRRNAR